MTITFETEADILLWAFAKFITTFHYKQYLFAAKGVWWLATMIALEPALVYLIDNQRFPSERRLEESLQQSIVGTSNELPSSSRKASLDS